MLYMIGATSEYANDINGAVVNVRGRGDKICKFSFASIKIEEIVTNIKLL